jgi:hypothetical protein
MSTSARDDPADLVRETTMDQPRPDVLIHGTAPVPVPRGQSYARWSTADLVAELVGVGGRPVDMYIEYGRRLERGDIKGDSRDGDCE